MAYTPPANNAVDFALIAYTVPANDAIDFEFGSLGDCFCTGVGYQAGITATNAMATMTGIGYQATIAGANG